jgi:transposase, IS30 family
MPGCDGFYGAAAQLMTADWHGGQGKLIKPSELCRRVIERTKNGWTSEQIGNRLIHERAPLSDWQERIYPYIYSK